MYSQVMYVLERVPALVGANPELAKVAPYSTVLELLGGDQAAIAKLRLPDLEKLATHYKIPVTYFFEPEDMSPTVSNALDAIRNKPGPHHELAVAIGKLSAKAAENLLAKVG